MIEQLAKMNTKHLTNAIWNSRVYRYGRVLERHSGKTSCISIRTRVTTTPIEGSFFDRLYVTWYKRVDMANGKTMNTTIDERALENLAHTLASFSAASEALRKQIVTLFPAKYGSALWWEQEEAKVDEALKRRDYKDFSSVDEMLTYLNMS